jgi:DNA-binding CsgD family transcriptional regulator
VATSIGPLWDSLSQSESLGFPHRNPTFVGKPGDSLGFVPWCGMAKVWRKSCSCTGRGRDQVSSKPTQVSKERTMTSLSEIKITQRDQQVLKLLVQGCSNKEIAAQLNISPRTVKQHLRTLFLRAGIRDGRKRVKLATAMFMKEEMESCNPVNG